jgi:hypothetical protein
MVAPLATLSEPPTVVAPPPVASEVAPEELSAPFTAVPVELTTTELVPPVMVTAFTEPPSVNPPPKELVWTFD